MLESEAVAVRQGASGTTTETATDEAGWIAAARRDPAAFAPLYGRYLDPVYRYCPRRLGLREAAEDATSLVFAKALAALPRYRDASFRAWLFAIAHNVVTDAYRGDRVDQPLAAAEGIADAASSPEEEALAAETGRDLLSLLAVLTPGQRRIVELRLSGLTGPEIARALGRSHGSVKVAQFRAFARLRALLDPASHDPGQRL